MKRIAVLTSGGDAPGMNAALRAVVRTAMHYELQVIGIKNGYDGLLRDKIGSSPSMIELNRGSVAEILHRGGTMLMTARSDDFMHDRYRRQAVAKMKDMGIDGLVVIGGDGTFMGAFELHKLGMPAVAIPGTIDNDLPFTDFTLGFDTALNTICDAVNHIRETNTSHGRASLVEVMGRHCGDLALYSGLACGAEMALIPEKPWSVDKIVQKLKVARSKEKNNCIIMLAEGAWESMEPFDLNAFAEEYASKLPENFKEGKWTSEKLAVVIETLTGIGEEDVQETRATVLGYIQRGGSPSANDRILGCRMGARAVELLNENISGRAVGIKDNSIVDIPIEDAVGKRRKARPDYIELMDILSL